MATLISKATGNFTAAGTWAPISAVANAEIDQDNGVTSFVITSYIYSATFVPGNVDHDGVALKFCRRNGTTGTVTVILENVTSPGNREGTLTINMADIAAIGAADVIPSSWYFFKFGSVVTPNGTDTYKVGVRSSTANQLTTPNTVPHMLRLTSAASAPAAGDKLIMIGEMTGAGASNSFTVTMDNTATTSFGPTVSGGPPQGMIVGDKCTLAFGTTASTAYYLKMKGILGVTAGGTFTIGTSGTPMPSTSSGILEFDSVANVDSGLVIGNGGTFNAYGNAKTVTQTLLTADKAAAATTLAVVSTSGWLASDELAIASTTRTAADCEKKTILTVDSGTGVTLTAGLTNAHSGTSPTQAEVINLTRNVKIRGLDGTHGGYVVAKATAVFAAQYVEFYFLGTNSDGKRGVESQTTTGSFDVQFCSAHESSTLGMGFAMNGGGAGNNFTCSNNVVYLAADVGIWIQTATTGINWTISNNIVIRVNGGSNTCFTINDVGGTFTGNTAVGSSGGGFVIQEAQGGSTTPLGTFSNLTAHSNAAVGIQIFSSFGTISNLSSWRNSTGLYLNGTVAVNGIRLLTIDTAVLFGNSSSSMVLFGPLGNVLCKSITLNGDTTFSTPRGLNFSGGSTVMADIFFENCDFGTVTGIKTAHTTSDLAITTAGNQYLTCTFRNCKFASATEIEAGTQAFMAPGSYIKSQKHDQTAGLHKSWFPYGTIDIDTGEYRTAAPSEKLTPLNASAKLESGPKRVAVVSGGTITFTTYVRKSASYNGNQPRLVLHKNVAAGISADTVLATASGGTGSYLTLTGTTPAVTDDAVLEAVVDCDGTAGVVNCDDWSAA